MKRIVLIAVVLASTVAGAKPYTDNKKTLSHDCDKEPEVVVSGNDNTFTLTGKCSTLSVTGNGNKISGDTVVGIAVSGNKNDVRVTATDKIALTGNDNDASYWKAVTKDKPAVTKTGKNNRVIKDMDQPSK